jgi:hypothetical protein
MNFLMAEIERDTETLDTNAFSACLIALRILRVLHSVRITGTQPAGRSSAPAITQE